MTGRDLIRAAEMAGLPTRLTRDGHVLIFSFERKLIGKLRAPRADSGKDVNRRALLNVRAQLRRHGVKI